MFKVGQIVKIKDTAFPGSPEERDKEVRGKKAEIITDLEQQLGIGWKGCFEVQIDHPITTDDDGIYQVMDTEIEQFVEHHR